MNCSHLALTLRSLGTGDPITGAALEEGSALDRTITDTCRTHRPFEPDTAHQRAISPWNTIIRSRVMRRFLVSIAAAATLAAPAAALPQQTFAQQATRQDGLV